MRLQGRKIMFQEREAKRAKKTPENRGQEHTGVLSARTAARMGNQAALQLRGLTNQEKGPNITGIPDRMKQSFEERSGFSFDDVRVHYNSEKPARLQALAYARGNHVYIGPGQEKHLPHELGHVVQQKQGRVRASTSINGLPVNDDERLEREADTIAHMQSGALDASPMAGQGQAVVQGIFIGPNASLLIEMAIPDGICKNLRDYLHSIPIQIPVLESPCPSSFDYTHNALLFKKEFLSQISHMCGDNEKLSSMLSDICHELSHAYDFISGKEKKEPPNGSTIKDETYLSTELRAWCREAISTMELNKHYGLKYDDSDKKELIHGWEMLDKSMLENIEGNQDNEIINRITRYMVRRQVFQDFETAFRLLPSWLNTRDQFEGQIGRLKQSVLAKKNDLYPPPADV